MTLTTPGSDEDFDHDPSGYDDRPRRRKWLSYVLIVLAVVAVALIGKWFASLGAVKNARSGRPPAPVAVARVVYADMPVTLSAVGTVTPIETAIVKSQLSGNVFAIKFQEGQLVHQGEIIAQIDPRPFVLQMQQA